MTPYRIALATLPFAADATDALSRCLDAIEHAARAGASLLCFPECYLPGYRDPDRRLPPPDARALEAAWATLAEATRRAGITAILGTERPAVTGLHAAALVLNPDGSRAGFQDKVQTDPSEEGVYTPATGRHLFAAGPLRFGVAICHEGWRYPETVRWAARRGAHVVFHQQYHAPSPLPTFHQSAVTCRAAENTCSFATVNSAFPGAPTCTALATPDGDLLASHPSGAPGLLPADLDLTQATGLLARRYRPVD
jgi:predicted amidohydrolase